MLRVPLILFLAVFFLQAVHAQDPFLQRRETGLPDELLPPELLRGPTRIVPPEGVTDGVGPDLDYGQQEVLVRIDEWQPWAFGATAGYEYQSNASLTPNTEIDDYLFRQSASLRGTFPLPSLSDSLFFDVGVFQQIYRYDELDVLDYDRIDADAGILWVLPQSAPSLLAGSVFSLKGSWYRMSEAWSFGDELFSNAGLGAGLLRSVPLSRNHSLLFNVTADVSLEASDPLPQRHEYAGLIAWQAQWAPRWESSVFARTVLYDYDTHDDWNTSLGATLDYVVRPWCRLGLSGSYIYNSSDIDVFDYENFTLGASLRLSVRF